MPDDLSKTGKQDDQRININQPHEVQYWTKALNVTDNELRRVVQKVGVMVKDVRRELGSVFLTFHSLMSAPIDVTLRYRS